MFHTKQPAGVGKLRKETLLAYAQTSCLFICRKALRTGAHGKQLWFQHAMGPLKVPDVQQHPVCGGVLVQVQEL
jgi:hypothetical protein